MHQIKTNKYTVCSRTKAIQRTQSTWTMFAKTTESSDLPILRFNNYISSDNGHHNESETCWGKGQGGFFFIESGFQWFFTFRKPAGDVTLNRVRIKWHKRSDRRMEIKMLKKALEEREASGGGFDGFDGGDGGMRIATITAVARAFNNASRRRPQVSHTHGESSN